MLNKKSKIIRSRHKKHKGYLDASFENANGRQVKKARKTAKKQAAPKKIRKLCQFYNVIFYAIKFKLIKIPKPIYLIMKTFS